MRLVRFHPVFDSSQITVVQNILEQLRALKYREKVCIVTSSKYSLSYLTTTRLQLVDLRHLFMDEGAGILDLGDLDDTEDAPSEVSLQMPGSYPKLKCNEAGTYSSVKGKT